MDISCTGNFKGKICEVNIQALPVTRKRYNKLIDVMVLHLAPSCQVWIDAQKGIRLIIDIGGGHAVFLDLYNKAFRVSFKIREDFFYIELFFSSSPYTHTGSRPPWNARILKKLQ